MPIVLRAQIQRIVRREEGQLFETQFLLPESAGDCPMWTREIKEAGSWLLSEAERLAPMLKAHPVIIRTASETQVQRAQLVPGNTREEKITNYRRNFFHDRRFLARAAENRKVAAFQRDLERKKLA